MTPAIDLVEPVTGSETTKTPKTASTLVPTKTPAPDLLPTMTPATDLVEPVTGSETTMTPAADLVPPMTTSDVVPAKPASDLVTTKTASDLVEPVDLIPNKMSGTSYFYKSFFKEIKLCEKH
jgi:hypothetical protein